MSEREKLIAELRKLASRPYTADTTAKLLKRAADALSAPAPSPSYEERAQAWLGAHCITDRCGIDPDGGGHSRSLASEFAAVAETARGEEREAIDGRIQALYDESYTQEGTQSMRAGLMAAQQTILDRSGPK